MTIANPIGELVLLDGRTTTGAAPGFRFGGGEAVWWIGGTWGGTTAKLQVKPPRAADFEDVTDAVAGANYTQIVKVPLGWEVRVSLEGGSGFNLSSTLTGA